MKIISKYKDFYDFIVQDHDAGSFAPPIRVNLILLPLYKRGPPREIFAYEPNRSSTIAWHAQSLGL